MKKRRLLYTLLGIRNRGTLTKEKGDFSILASPGDVLLFTSVGYEMMESRVRENGTMRQAILDERGRELYAEGMRRQDLLRNGSYISTALAMGRQAQPYDTLYPIPQAIIVQGEGVIGQNPGYGN